MGFLDDLGNAVAGLLRELKTNVTGQRRILRDEVEDEADVEAAASEVGALLEDATAADEIAEAATQILEEAILEDLQEAGEIDPEDASELAADVEGGSVATIAALGAVGTAVETASVGQLETQQEFLMQALAGLQLDDVTGTELEVRVQEGIAPALQAQVNADHRSKFADLADVVEQQLRNKDADTDWLDDLGTYGIRPEDVGILEEVAIREMEPEELLETPVEAGVFPSPDLVSQELDRTGVSEDVKGLFEEVAEELPSTVRAYEENPQAEELVTQLDSLVASGVLSPTDAAGEVGFLPPEAQNELLQRWTRLEGLPNKAPTRAQVEAGFTNGLIDISRYLDLLDQVDVDPQEHPYVPEEAILNELDGDLRRAVGLGLLGEGQYAELVELVGLDENIKSRLLAGEDLDTIAESRLQESADQGELAVDVVSGIGASRRATLEAAGIETVSGLAGSQPGDVTEFLAVSEETAAEFISRAQQLTE